MFWVKLRIGAGARLGVSKLQRRDGGQRQDFLTSSHQTSSAGAVLLGTMARFDACL